MPSLDLYFPLTYVETYDDQIRTTPVSLDKIATLLKTEKFLRLGDELLNVSNIKRVFAKEMTDVDKIIYAIEDKQLKEKVKAEVSRRQKEWLRVNVNIVQNLVQKFS